MKNFRPVLILFLALAACSGIPVETTPTYLATSTVSATITLPPTTSSTSRPPKQTRIPSVAPTQTLTPTATLPLFYQTPTFDPASIVTVTPAPAAQCPTVDPNYKPVLPDQGKRQSWGYVSIEIHLQNGILDALNQGASVAALRAALPEVKGEGESLELVPENITEQDLTGDGVPEVVFFNDDYRYAVYTCKDGAYVLALDLSSDGMYRIKQITVEDLNLDNRLEIVVGASSGISVHPWGIDLFVFGWDGSAFQSMVATDNWHEFYLPEVARYEITGQEGLYEIQDTNQDGLKEIVAVLSTEILDDPSSGPTRDVTSVIAWNGEAFALQPRRYAPPVYRFQAIHDGDRAFLRWDFAEALAYYQQALNDANLKGWSQAHFDQMLNVYDARMSGKPTPTPFPLTYDDRPFLTAYARFKISLIHLAQGQEELAVQEYERLQQEYAEGKPGYEFAQMAKAFWDEYSTGHNLAEACASARSFAESHEQGTSYQINWEWHGFQSPGYGDPLSLVYMCPFE